ncbi:MULTISPECIES: EscU/YscU/HrcU family type III secretion system export apparatus switch protein [Pandoraea]|uniref:EscU/YscU/HrcU family type III secretion system export apparatus switch protein n=1 Tax=Pandoraea TaxID=93217 RepID=UPI001F5C619C|nr:MULTISPECIES: EscU/YscU/HrcU family type III secretion system export apparatus switch protein [Pandoraea]MCI3207300.1 EscU/YscU/HrcU family type III secretion system export apparatus switch protein [Pandoraea sp. LA3]MDN4585329.1 EscU/YscU/HrcU family type III secretion system export apparatus switch protein [Pandoraea capi]
MGEKTEKPTQKRLRDAAKKGQSFKSKELTMVTLVFVGLIYVFSTDPLIWLMQEYRQVLADGQFANPQAFAVRLFRHGLEAFLPVLLVCIVAAVLPTLLQTGFVWAGQALKLNLGAVNPMQGAKRIFSMRTLKDAIKSVLYLLSFGAIAVALWSSAKGLLFAQIHMSPAGVGAAWVELVMKLVWIALVCVVPIAVLDAMVEFWLFMREQRMERHEVKREQKDSDGNPEIKQKRRTLHSELLSEAVKSDVRDSRLIIANPTHIAVGIYFRPDIVPLPFISVMETNARALAVRRYAESQGVPVIGDVALARRLYRTHRRYTFASIEEIDAIMRLLVWLEDVERAGMHDESEIEEKAEEAEDASKELPHSAGSSARDAVSEDEAPAGGPPSPVGPLMNHRGRWR